MAWKDYREEVLQTLQTRPHAIPIYNRPPDPIFPVRIYYENHITQIPRHLITHDMQIIKTYYVKIPFLRKTTTWNGKWVWKVEYEKTEVADVIERKSVVINEEEVRKYEEAAKRWFDGLSEIEKYYSLIIAYTPCRVCSTKPLQLCRTFDLLLRDEVESLPLCWDYRHVAMEHVLEHDDDINKVLVARAVHRYLFENEYKWGHIIEREEDAVIQSSWLH